MDRNPSPPSFNSTLLRTSPDKSSSKSPADNILQENSLAESGSDGNRIGDTVFSKLWVVSLLEKILHAASGRCPTELVSENDNGSKSASLQSSENGQELIVEETSCNQDHSSPVNSVPDGNKGDESPTMSMDADLEEEVCLLWDASANSEVAMFLCEQDAVRLLLEVADSTPSLRFKEICIGIAGNMACTPAICKKELCTLDTMKLMLCFLASSDTGVLTQMTRCLLLCFAHKEARMVEQHQHLVDLLLGYLTFILKSSTNDELLKYGSSLLSELLEGSEQLLDAWAGEGDLVDAICEAIEQTSSSSTETMSSLIMTLQLLTTKPEGVKSTVSQKWRVFHASLSCLCTLDYLDLAYYNTILAATSTYLCVYDHAVQDRATSDNMPTVIVEEETKKVLLELLSQANKMEDDSIEAITQVKKLLQEVLDKSTL